MGDFVGLSVGDFVGESVDSKAWKLVNSEPRFVSKIKLGNGAQDAWGFVL